MAIESINPTTGEKIARYQEASRGEVRAILERADAAFREWRGVSFEDRQDLLGHKSGRITTHYSAAELENLIEAANRVCGENSRKSPALVLLKQKTATG